MLLEVEEHGCEALCGPRVAPYTFPLRLVVSPSRRPKIMLVTAAIRGSRRNVRFVRRADTGLVAEALEVSRLC